MRAHKDMDYKMSLKSLIVPWHNEWLSIWFYIAFALYFWVSTLLIMIHDKKNYDFIHHNDYEFMFIATIGFAASLTLTAVYLIFYSQSKELRNLLEAFDYMGKLIGFYGFSFAFIGSQLVGSKL